MTEYVNKQAKAFLMKPTTFIENAIYQVKEIEKAQFIE